jgi:hypothetical protein
MSEKCGKCWVSDYKQRQLDNMLQLVNNNINMYINFDKAFCEPCRKQTEAKQ